MDNMDIFRELQSQEVWGTIDQLQDAVFSGERPVPKDNHGDHECDEQPQVRCYKKAREEIERPRPRPGQAGQHQGRRQITDTILCTNGG